jgi:dienelactone hydrolase
MERFHAINVPILSLDSFGRISDPRRHVSMKRVLLFALVLSLALAASTAQDLKPLPGTTPLTLDGDLSAQMVAGADKFLLRELERSPATRSNLWKRDFSSPAAYQKSINPNRERFRKIIGAVDSRSRPATVEYVSSTAAPAKIAETDLIKIFAVRWATLEGVAAEGLLLQPKGDLVARVVAVPDADQTPEQIAGLASGVPPESQFARRLAENGCAVLVPTLVNRQDTYSGNEALKRFTNLPHREWIYRQAFEVGRHIIGYEVQRILAGVDWFEFDRTNKPPAGNRPGAPAPPPSPIGVAGYGEGALLALYSAALDDRIDATLVSGYFNTREAIWEEPIYRNVFRLLTEFGDAEIASLIAPRALIIEHSESPKIEGPPKARSGRSGAAPGKWQTPDFNTVDFEFQRARELARPFAGSLRLIHGNEGMSIGPGSEKALTEFLGRLGWKGKSLQPVGSALTDARGKSFDPEARQKRQVGELVDYTQRLLRASERDRNQSFWSSIAAKNADQWAAEVKPRQTNMWENLFGRFPKASEPSNPRSRRVHDMEKWTGYEIVLDVWPDVFAWGVLLLPKDIKPGERRPVVVCQHGLEGLPQDTITADPKASGYGPYKAFSARLAERGFVVFAPHNLYRGQDRFRVLQRKAQPLGRTLFSIILAQHDRILDWLSEQSFVDPQRIGFYGLSYGGKTAMRVPSLLDRYCLSICSADFNEWAGKCATIDSPYSYLYTIEHDMYEFDLAHTFSYAEMAALVAPRPFMVERGHDDGVAPDEWVAHEYSRVRRFYDRIGIGDRTEIEFFNGPHTINGMGTFRFLHKHLNWPEPK